MRIKQKTKPLAVALSRPGPAKDCLLLTQALMVLLLSASTTKEPVSTHM